MTGLVAQAFLPVPPNRGTGGRLNLTTGKSCGNVYSIADERAGGRLRSVPTVAASGIARIGL